MYLRSILKVLSHWMDRRHSKRPKRLPCPVAMLFYTEEAGLEQERVRQRVILQALRETILLLGNSFLKPARLFATVWTNLTTRSHYLPCSMVKEQKVEGSQPSPTAAMSALRLQTIWGRWFYLILVKGQKPSLK